AAEREATARIAKAEADAAATLDSARREAATMVERARADVAALAATPAAAPAAAPAASPGLQRLCEIRYEDLKFDTDVDGFRLELGRGGFGAVFAGTFCGERVAIKKLPTAPAVYTTFWDEVALHMRASHRHVVRVLGAAIREREDTGEVDCFVVMERAVTDVGSALYKSFKALHPAARLQRLMTEQPYRLRLLLEISRGLRFLHAKGVVHADLKPENVMLDADGHAQLTDFGMSVQRRLEATRTRTREWGRGGTPVYMDPAFACGASSVKPASDMYAWGVLAWELLTMRKPYEGVSSGGAGASAGAGVTGSSSSVGTVSFLRLTFDGVPPKEVLALVTPGVPPELCDLICRCWAEEQSARPTAEEVIAVLERIVGA
ncbi:MAG: hypothetical protein EOO41_00765, partial [Methanobacteriota archaeon]